jgi:hypothetical protein
MLNRPVSVYINWAAYDELSDNIELTETLAQRQLDELLRLRGLGVQFDYYLMDAFWYAPDGAYRTWRKPHWPNGPDAWLERCLKAGVKPALWVTANTLCKMECPPAWKTSLDEKNNAFCCFYGGFLPDFMQALHEWYERGVRAFKFDFANFGAAPEAWRRVMLPAEIRAANVSAWQGAMKVFRQAHPEVLLLGYNGYEEASMQSGTGLPLVKGIDPRWLDVFDSLYCGDPRPADVPAMNFWRSKDVYSDHMVRMYEANGMPLPRIDNSGFMIGTTGTCYYRRTAAWQGMLILSLARGGWVNTYYGNLDLLDEKDARWFACVQKMYLDLQATAAFSTFGGMPGEGNPYGFAALRGGHGLLAVVNPGQVPAELPLPAGGPLRLLFHDAGFVPEIKSGCAGTGGTAAPPSAGLISIRLGPEQMALVGVGDYGVPDYDLGLQADVRIPHGNRLLEEFSGQENVRQLERVLETPPREGRLRIVMRQRDAAGPVRSSGGSPPKGKPMGQLLTLRARQDGRDISVEIAYDKAIWSGLSWAVGEVDCTSLAPGRPLSISLETKETRPLTLHAAFYHITP